MLGIEPEFLSIRQVLYHWALYLYSLHTLRQSLSNAVQAGLELVAALLHKPIQCSDYRCHTFDSPPSASNASLAGYGGAHLWFQHWGGWDRDIVSSIFANLVYIYIFLVKTNKQTQIITEMNHGIKQKAESRTREVTLVSKSECCSCRGPGLGGWTNHLNSSSKGIQALRIPQAPVYIPTQRQTHRNAYLTKSKIKFKKRWMRPCLKKTKPNQPTGKGTHKAFTPEWKAQWGQTPLFVGRTQLSEQSPCHTSSGGMHTERVHSTPAVTCTQGGCTAHQWWHAHTVGRRHSL